MFPIKCGRCNKIFKEIKDAEKHFKKCRIENLVKNKDWKNKKQK